MSVAKSGRTSVFGELFIVDGENEFDRRKDGHSERLPFVLAHGHRSLCDRRARRMPSG